MIFSISTQRILRGLAKSWTANTGVILAVLGFLQTQDKLLEKWFGPDVLGFLMLFFGILVIGLRAKTNESLATKGSK